MIESLYIISFAIMFFCFLGGLESSRFATRLTLNGISLLFAIVCFVNTMYIQIPSTGEHYTEYGFQFVFFAFIVINAILMIIWFIASINEWEIGSYTR